jgi:hypothetical protein
MWLAIFAGAAAVLLVAKPFSAPADADARDCGTKLLYGKTLTLHIAGKGLTCADVERITSGDQCDVDGKPWFCFAPQTGPALVWAKDKERFSDKHSAWIEARRYPCSQASVTAADWQRARASTSEQFPAEQQLLADDLIRCKLLKGKRYAAVRALLGKPDEHTGRKELDYTLGIERDSLFQIDSEFLSVAFTRKGGVKSVSIDQG